MYDPIVVELVEPGARPRFIGDRSSCRYCGTTVASDFGKKKNAHAYPVALGNKALFSLDECKACNTVFSIYEDALTKAIGPFLTLGGVKGRSGVRQTGRSDGKSKIKHTVSDTGRHLHVTSSGAPQNLVGIDQATGLLRLEMPIEGDKFVPRYAYKALLKIALSLLPKGVIGNFRNALNCLASKDAVPHDGFLQVGFSNAYIGNAPPTLGGCLLRRNDDTSPAPHTVFLFMAGSVCFQIWVRSDGFDSLAPDDVRLSTLWTSQLPKPEGGYHPIQYSQPVQFDWSTLQPQLQPFEAFELIFDPKTTESNFSPILR